MVFVSCNIGFEINWWGFGWVSICFGGDKEVDLESCGCLKGIVSF